MLDGPGAAVGARVVLVGLGDFVGQVGQVQFDLFVPVELLLIPLPEQMEPLQELRLSQSLLGLLDGLPQLPGDPIPGLLLRSQPEAFPSSPVVSPPSSGGAGAADPR
jgi:hypothetical protein